MRTYKNYKGAARICKGHYISATKVFDHFGLSVLVINTITVGLAGAIFPPGPPGGVGLSDKSHHHGRAGVE